MADKLIIDGDTSGAIAALDKLSAKLKDTTQGIGSVMSKMQDVAVGLAASLTAAGTAAAAFADDITDLAAANQLAVGEVLALSEALGQSGGKADNAGMALQKLSNAVDDANGGNLKLVASFNKMGISISDLGSKSNTEIRDKLLDSLAAIPDAMERNARATEFFGKSLQGVDIVKFAAEQKKNREEMEKYAPALQSAGDAWDNLSAIAFKTKVAFAEAFKPLFDLIAKLNPSVDELTIKFRLMGAALAIAGSAAVVAGLMKVYETLKLITLVVSRNPLVALAGALATLGIGAATYMGLAKGAGDATDENTDKINEQDKAVKKVDRSQEGYNKKIQDTKEKLSLVSQELAKNLSAIQDKLTKEFEYLGLTQDEIKIAQQKADIDKATADAKYNLEKQYKALNQEEQDATAAHHKQVLADLDAQGAKAKANAEDQMKSTQALANMYKQLQDVANVAGNSQKAVFDAQTKFALSRIQGINDEIAATAKVNAVNDLRANLLNRVSQLAESDRASAIKAINDITYNTDYLAGSFEDVSSAMKAAFANYDLGANKAKTLTLLTKEPFDEFLKGGNKVAEVNKQISDQSRTFADGWGQAFKEYARAAGDSAALANNLFKKFTQGIEDNLVTLIKGGKVSWKEFVASLGEELLRNQIRQGIASVLGSIGESLKDQGGLLGSIGKIFGIGGTSTGGAPKGTSMDPIYVRSAGTGIGDMFGVGSKQQDQTSGITKQISSVFDSLKKTLSGLTDSVSNIFGGISNSLGNIFGGITDTLGGLFGDLGSSIYDIIGSLGSSFGNMFSGGFGGGGGGGSWVDDLIGGVTDFFSGDLFGSIGSLFGFAKGGMIPTNDPVLVGENGPEILTGAAGQNVIPLGNNQTYVTYNINAVDAPSFKAMIAADPSFIYAVSMQGAKGIPSRR